MRKSVIATVCRLLLGVVFVFSGLMKLNDSWGTVQTVGSYFGIIGLNVGWLNCAVAVGWSAVELTLGVMLLTWMWRRLVAWLVMLLMWWFTLLTLFIAVFNPMDDCGCFGEALRMSNWFSFGKNVVLLIAATYLWKRIKGIEKVSSNWLGGVTGFVIFVLGSGFGAHSYTHLPAVDLFEFPEGTSLRTDIVCTACMNGSAVLIYKDLTTGKEHKFDLSDTTYYDSSRWEWVATQTAFDKLSARDYEKDFAVYCENDNVVPQIVDYKGIIALFIIRDVSSFDACKQMKAESILLANQNALPILITVLDKEKSLTINEITILGSPVNVYRMDAKVLGQLLRADFGVVWIRDGIITEKLNLL